MILWHVINAKNVFTAEGQSLMNSKKTENVSIQVIKILTVRKKDSKDSIKDW